MVQVESCSATHPLCRNKLHQAIYIFIVQKLWCKNLTRSELCDSQTFDVDDVNYSTTSWWAGWLTWRIFPHDVCMTSAKTTNDNFILPALPVGGLPLHYMVYALVIISTTYIHTPISDHLEYLDSSR